MRNEQQLARAAGRLAGKWLPRAKQSRKLARHYSPTARQSGQFLKHVVPAVVKPLHALWHEVLAFIFIVVAGSGAWWLWRHRAAEQPVQLVFVAIFVVVIAGYGISSVRKSRRITRS
ncbi:MAG: hypothetical protein M3N54_04500 [Acidobacteriota bacterium]|nr:hypothetical protein [Acidobacteriota bacterium]